MRIAKRPGLSIFAATSLSYCKTQEDAITTVPTRYKAAGVDIAAGNRLVEAIKPLAKATTRAGCLSEIGGFGSLFDLKAAGFRDPILVSARRTS